MEFLASEYYRYSIVGLLFAGAISFWTGRIYENLARADGNGDVRIEDGTYVLVGHGQQKLNTDESVPAEELYVVNVFC